MSKILVIILFFLQIIKIIISSTEVFQTLSDTGNKGAALTSFNNNLILLSSSKIFNVINNNYNLIQDNKDQQTQTQLNSNFEIVESSINKATKESTILIAECDSATKKINLYNFNISAQLDSNNPKLIHSIQSQIYNNKISLIKIGTDKYLLSYFISLNKLENLVFKYTSYEGFEILKKFENSGNFNNFISCFLLYDQFPICYYSDIRTITISSQPTDKHYQKIIALDTIFNRGTRIGDADYTDNSNNIVNYDKIYFNKGIYLSDDYAIFCYMENNGNFKVTCDLRKLEIEFDSFTISYNSICTIYTNNECSYNANNLNNIDLIKVDDKRFLFACIKSDNKPIIDLIKITNSFTLDSRQSLNINLEIKSTLNLFTHKLFTNNNHYGIIFDSNDNKVKYGYLNLPKCTKKENKEILKLEFDESVVNKFKLLDYLDKSIENEYPSSILTFQNYKIISFISNDNYQNIFNYKIFKNDGSQLNIGDIITENEEITIKPRIDQVFSNGKFYIEIAPIYDTNIQGRSCLFEFDAICYEGCNTCKKYDDSHTQISKHFCLSCKSNYYSLNDLCLTDCSLATGYRNAYQTKECILNQMEFINDCIYKIWYINQASENNYCSDSSFCPQTIPYVYNSTGECIESCRYSELVGAECYISNILGGGPESLTIIKNKIEELELGDDIFEKNDESKVNKSIVIYGNNITIEITDTQKINNDINKNDLISDLNITECKNKINMGNDKELIIVKIDLRRNDTIASQIEYELFEPDTKSIIDLSTCSNIIYKSPIYVNNSYANKIKEIYDEGYDIFEIENNFYSDLCVPYYDKNFHADLTLEKRQLVYYYMNANLCEAKCEYKGFDINTFKSECDCPIKKEVDLDITKEEVFDYIEESKQKIYYKDTISNLKTVKCFKYIFSTKGFKYNWGSYFIMLMIIGFVVFTVLWFVYGEDLILIYIREILDVIIMKNEMKSKEKFKKKFEEMTSKDKHKIKNTSNKTNEKEKINTSNGAIQSIQNQIDSNQEQSEKTNNQEKSDNQEISENKEKEEEQQNITNEIKVNNNDENKNDKDILSSKNQLIEKEEQFYRKKGPKKNALLIRSIALNKENKLKEEIISPKKEQKLSNNLTDIEKDSLPYEQAKEIDDRTFAGYYWSLLKYRQLIIFTFFSYNDYNFFFIKAISFFLLLSLNLAYNIIFFFDKIINEIYDDKGKYSMKLQILNIFICSLIFSFSIILVRFIITSHRKYIKLKQYEDYDEAKKESYSIHKRLVIRYIIFIVVAGILMLGIWYFVTGFCAIFHYTQNHMFLNAFFSFLFSMIYSFAYLLLPAMFRYLGLNKNKKCCYCFSQYI